MIVINLTYFYGFCKLSSKNFEHQLEKIYFSNDYSTDLIPGAGIGRKKDCYQSEFFVLQFIAPQVLQ